ncbi:sodium:proton antiporter [Herbaspirillum rubrisubalbicans]|jgi:Kef-type K+ transport system membrane component KefB|uniref:Sodium:proton antiporter n=2 Tax=Herbaspirillum rubrisubalbicans TaxID=80842 RepID=A0AAD0U9S5_9BURK|nr:cation:proton antiporter [Herbaspirillum rubrisubalbicans]ALU87950.1 transmembrane protein [Herbaspirillum rubrisubalbicans M1]AYR22989.1 sodium:proton antiporter [Herbaspirillum rubrisubalbicans]MCP1576153.1 Kef-type K+ transport system membrane component KefB [Herbaspirillum rubrisubalbicans]NQE48907.1 sodium:proton antiporter [Herbaspirillum rubrisubalbicans]QJP99410.1 sodium:proton antiporter [Herbaspirillum rubrisubalbicans Os34]
MEWALPSFTLAQTLQWNALLVFGGLLLFGLIAGYVVSKSPWVPRITGYLLVGFLLGAGGFNLLSGEVLKVTNIFADIAVALVVYQLGRYVDIGWLRREKWLLITVAVSAVLCFGFVSIALTWFGTDSVLALLGGVMAIATAPAVVLVVLRDLKAEGQVTRRLAAMTALNNFVAVLAAYALLPVIAHEAGTPVWTLIQHTLYSLVGSAILAYLTYWLMMPLARLLGRENSSQFVLVISVIALAIGVAHALHLPVMLTMLIFAILSKNLDRQFDLMELEFGVANELFVVMLFVTVGASMKLSDLSLLGYSVLILIAARFLAMGLGIFLFARFARMNWRQAGLLTLGTLPMTEIGVGLMQTVSSLYPHTTANVVPLLAGSMVVLEFLGPVATQFALIKSGESGRE